MSEHSYEPEMDIGQPETRTQSQPQKYHQHFWIIAGGAVLVIVLAGAAYLAGNLLNRNVNNQNSSNGNQAFSQGDGPVTKGSGPGTVSMENSRPQITPAPELPTVQADARGIFLSRSGNTFAIGSGNVDYSFQGNGSGQDATPSVSYAGPTYEVVITRDTRVYKDTTPRQRYNTHPIQQTVAPGSLDDLNTITMVSVWGKKTGNRYVADVIVYQKPLIKLNGGEGGTPNN